MHADTALDDVRLFEAVRVQKSLDERNAGSVRLQKVVAALPRIIKFRE